ncbi:UDP-N-acetylmuramate dehydrogenase [Salinispirillum marinum]|uniref:UDP-N-acetylenolpyruvoylglucosamine reductase n=2 Tax=Saccharospirillaceae TaxID=255527 RepID=A0ABV8BDY0_9GAMM
MTVPVNVQSRFNLQSFHTLACPSVAEFAVEAVDRSTLIQALSWARQQALPIQILGEGSNVVPEAWIPGLTIINRLAGLKCTAQDSHYVSLKVASGVSWHWLVLFTSAQGWYGLENLALIPGTVGAAPVQNIGAYGVEFRDVFSELTAVHVLTGELRTFGASACRFGYRESVFKQEEAGQWCILDVTLRLARQFKPTLTYGPLAMLQPVSSRELIDTVVRVRQEKLPDPKVIPNAGSFFTNPLVDVNTARRLKETWPDLPVYPQENGHSVKLAAGWLIEQAGLKGQYDSITGIGAYEKQALVLINPQCASGQAVLAQAQLIADVVEDRFGVHLTPEPRMFP